MQWWRMFQANDGVKVDMDKSFYIGGKFHSVGLGLSLVFS